MEKKAQWCLHRIVKTLLKRPEQKRRLVTAKKGENGAGYKRLSASKTPKKKHLKGKKATNQCKGKKKAMKRTHTPGTTTEKLTIDRSHREGRIITRR